MLRIYLYINEIIKNSFFDKFYFPYLLIISNFINVVDVRLDTSIFSVNMQDTIEEEEIPMPSMFY